MSKSFLIKICIYLAVLGGVISGYLLYLYVFSLPIPCSNNGCEIVRNSPYSKLFGISMPFYGLVFYLSVLVTSVVVLFKKIQLFAYGLLGLTVSGFLFSIYLTGLEVFIIKAICVWCVISAVIASVLMMFGILAYKRLGIE